MEWLTSLRKAIKYMEKHLLDDISAENIAEEVNISPYYLQNGFRIMTGYAIGEYLRCRRLYMAALDIVADREKLIDLAFKYGYDTPESFTKAFRRFHGASPSQVRKDTSRIKTFLPLNISVSIQGGNAMDYVVEKMTNFQVIGFEREFGFESSYQAIPKFWDEFWKKYMASLLSQNEPKGDIRQAVWRCKIGEYGVCIDDVGEDGKFRYLIAGIYDGGPVPEGLTLYSFPDTEWAKFRCCGPMPGALQSVNTKIFREWLPGNPDYEMTMGANIEWYSQGNTSAPDYESAIWLPVKKK